LTGRNRMEGIPSPARSFRERFIGVEGKGGNASAKNCKTLGKAPVDVKVMGGESDSKLK